MVRSLPAAASLTLVMQFLGFHACKSPAGTPLEHRSSDVACPRGVAVGSTSTGGSCQSVSDCALGPNVACVPYGDAGASFCNYDACRIDLDCADGGVCACAGGTPPETSNRCLAAGNCRIDADCSPVHYCSPSSTGCGGTFAWYCHTASDDCTDDTDCRPLHFCQFSPSLRRWTCVSASSCGG